MREKKRRGKGGCGIKTSRQGKEGVEFKHGGTASSDSPCVALDHQMASRIPDHHY